MNLNFKFSIKQLIICISTILLIGLSVPLILSFSQDDSRIPYEVKTEAHTSIQKALKLITIYQSFDKQDDGTIVANTHTIFNIVVQKEYFKTDSTTMEYFPLSK